jgi:predicted GNAT family acetyltransferase
MQKKIRVKSLKSYEDWERGNLYIKNEFFKHSSYIPRDNLKLVYSGNQVIGALSFEKEASDKIFIKELVINEDLRGRGLGLKTVPKIVKYFKYKGVKEIKLICEEKLVSFYNKNNIEMEFDNGFFYSTIITNNY